MITSLTKQNKGLYQKFFEDVSKEVNYEVASLQDFFQNLTDIGGIKDGKFLILPLDEEPLKIDANKRTITLPASFKKNGIGVMGDQIAEILFFKIDRYFDTTDLYNETIQIEWENANGEIGFSGPYPTQYVVTENGNDYVYFGWPISEELTETPGNIKFSVRFYSIDEINGEKKVVYSLRTLPATATIHNTLNLDVLENDSYLSITTQEAKEIIQKRFKNSPQTDTGVIAGLPLWAVNILESTKDLNENTEPEFMVSAYTEDYGTISYKWYRKETENSLPELIENNINTVYLPTEDTTINLNKVYYKEEVSEDDSGLVGYVVVDLKEETAFPTDYIIYEEYSAYNADTAGFYYAEAINRIGSSHMEIQSNVCEIPGAEELPLEKNPISYILGSSDPDSISIQLSAGASMPSKGTTSTKWYDLSGVLEGETANSLDLTNRQEENAYYAVVTHNRNNTKVETQSSNYYVTNAPENPVFDESSVPPTTNTFVETGEEIRVGFLVEQLKEVEFLPEELRKTIEIEWYSRTANNNPNSLDLEGITKIDTTYVSFKNVNVEGQTIVYSHLNVPTLDTGKSIFVVAKMKRNGAVSEYVIPEGMWNWSEKKE